MSQGKKLLKNEVGEIKTQQDYESVMSQIERLITKGNGSINNDDLTLYSNLAKSAQRYENAVYSIDEPRTLEGLLEWKMFELKIKQKELAKRIHVSDAKLSLVLSGKQKPDALMLKSIHQELKIDGNVLLSVL